MLCRGVGSFKIGGPLQVGRLEIADYFPVQIEHQGIVQWPHGLRIKHVDLFHRMFLPPFQLRPDLMDGILSLPLQIVMNDGTEKKIGVSAYVFHALPAGEESGPVALPLLLVRPVNHGAAFSLSDFYVTFVVHPV